MKKLLILSVLVLAGCEALAPPRVYEGMSVSNAESELYNHGCIPELQQNSPDGQSYVWRRQEIYGGKTYIWLHVKGGEVDSISTTFVPE